MKKKLQVRKTKAAIAMVAARLKRSSLEGNKSSGGSHRNIDFRDLGETKTWVFGASLKPKKTSIRECSTD